VDALRDGFQRLTRVWSSELDATRALTLLLERNGLEVAHTTPGTPERWTLRTTDGEPVAGSLNLFYRPGPRPGWVSFQVSM
jgi:hypothetical protein